MELLLWLVTKFMLYYSAFKILDSDKVNDWVKVLVFVLTLIVSFNIF